ncbi:hypothetical protein GCM10010129_57310 [Streptomyces fumigatiscleroticus]|nr:hypothetical protein GCM10010129_57310 [Streptomyces fumigatiscleroticus]
MQVLAGLRFDAVGLFSLQVDQGLHEIGGDAEAEEDVHGRAVGRAYRSLGRVAGVVAGCCRGGCPGGPGTGEACQVRFFSSAVR